MGEVFAAFRDDPELRVAIAHRGRRPLLLGRLGPEGDRGRTASPDWDMGVGGFGGLQELPGLNKPVIAAVNGMAVGGGFEVAMSADLIVAAEHAQFALPEIKAGILADAATIKLHRRIPYHLAMDLLMTGRWIDAPEAQRVGPRPRRRARRRSCSTTHARSPARSPTGRRSCSPRSRR